MGKYGEGKRQSTEKRSAGGSHVYMPGEKATPPREDETLVIGRNAVAELLLGRRQVDCVYICGDVQSHGQPLSRIIGLAKDKGVPVKQVHQKKLEALTGGQYHQGVAARTAAYAYSTLSEILQLAKDKHEPPFLLLTDGLEDPHNLGAVIRTAEAAGMHGVIIPKRAGASLTPIVGRTSAGAVEHMRVARVTNLVSAIEELKHWGLWIYGADVFGRPWAETPLTGPLALVVGGEGKGLSRLVKERCDGLVSLPMLGQVGSLNASVAAGVVIYEALRQRLAQHSTPK